MNEQNLSTLHRQYLEPADEVALEGWNDIEIYSDEDYWEINGDYVPAVPDVMEEWAKENDIVAQFFMDNGTLRKAEDK